MSGSPLNKLLIALLLLTDAAAFPQTADSVEIDKLLDRGFAAFSTGNYPEMVTSGNEALRLSLAAHDQARIARSLVLVGSADYAQGRFAEGLDALQKGRQSAADLNDIPLQKQAVRWIGNTFRQLGRFDDALRSFDQWLALNRQLAQPEPEAPMTHTLCILYRQMGDPDKGERTCREALKLAGETGNAQLRSGILLTLGAMYKDRGRFREAIPFHEEALRIAEGGGFKDRQAEILNSLGDAYNQLGEPNRAAQYLQSAIEAAHAIGYRPVEGQASMRLGDAELAAGHYPEAAQQYARIAAQFSDLYPRVIEEHQYYEGQWGEAERFQGHHEAALDHYYRSLADNEKLEYLTLPTEGARAVWTLHGRSLGEVACGVLMEMNRPAEAFNLAERTRSWAFLHAVSESKIDLRATLTPDERSREDELMRKAAETRAPSKSNADALQALENFYLNLRRSNPAYAQIRRPEFATVESIQKELAAPGDVLLEYMLSDDRSIAWVVTSDSVRAVLLPPRKELQTMAQAWRAALNESVTALTASSSSARRQEQGRRLYNALIAPFAKEVSTAKRLYIVADGVLAYLPFEALTPDGRTFLLDQGPVSYWQSATAHLQLRALRRDEPAPPKSFLGFGDTSPAGNLVRLPHTRDELLAISRLFPEGNRALYLGPSATETELKRQNLRDYRYLHFAVHGLVDEDNPARSALALTVDHPSPDDGMLRMEEIALLRTHAELVTLSACRTAIGKLLPGEGLMALSRAFFYAGAQKLVATLWDVNDASTVELMKSMYQHLAEGREPAEALRLARLSLLHGRSELWRDPHFWAPFVLLE